MRPSLCFSLFAAATVTTSAPLADAPAPVVELDYATYEGSFNSLKNLNAFLGVRYAAPPTGKLRWQLPQAPAVNKTAVIQATSNPPRCPQAPSGPYKPTYNFTTSGLGDEDCLFLNIFAPPNAKGLPVFVWIHGGGYGLGSATSDDFSQVDKTMNNSFVIVNIQYRLGAFGFLSSDELARHGSLNAGAHDMRFALKWVQKYISKFGGDPDAVTIGGESAGGGSVMLMAMANNGTDRTTLWRRGISSSPYLPKQWGYNDYFPTQFYYQFAERAGCLGENVTQPSSVFACLQAADTLTLQRANSFTSMSARSYEWAFIPVTDGSLLVSRPTDQLLAGRVNGEKMLATNNANEGYYFVPQQISTQDQFVDWLQRYYPAITPENVTTILAVYTPPAGITASSPKFDSNGLTAPYVTSTSHAAVGWQEAANNLYAETTFVCSAYWLADAYTKPASSDDCKASWRYQYSVTDAFHGQDLGPLEGDATLTTAKADPAFRVAQQSIWGNMILHGDPTLRSNASVLSAGVAAAKKCSWKPWGPDGWSMLNLNMTMGANSSVADFSVADGYKWEDGRGDRCALWARLGPFALN